MIHPACAKRGKHQWSLWYPHVTQDGELKQPPYLYKRECEAMGCDIIQLVEQLFTLDTPDEIDTGETDKALAEHAKLKRE